MYNSNLEKLHPGRDSSIYKVAANNPFTSSSKIKNEIALDFGIGISFRTIRRGLNKKNLHGCIVQSKPLGLKKSTKS